ncbi:MAG: hemerythrin domain-containing protein [Sulfuriferula sp.]
MKITHLDEVFAGVFQVKLFIRLDKDMDASPSKKDDAITLLKEDHKKVKELFKEFEKLEKTPASKNKKSTLVKEICEELTIHAQVEEEIFYPAVRDAIEDQDMMDEAKVEHAGAKELISQLEKMTPEEDLYDAKVTVLSEYIDHHVKEEEGEMFSSIKKSKLDMTKLGSDMRKRKDQLKLEMKKSADSSNKSTHTKKSGATSK